MEGNAAREVVPQAPAPTTWHPRHAATARMLCIFVGSKARNIVRGTTNLYEHTDNLHEHHWLNEKSHTQDIQSCVFRYKHSNKQQGISWDNSCFVFLSFTAV